MIKFGILASDYIVKTVIVLLVGMVVGAYADRSVSLNYKDSLNTCIAAKGPLPPLPHARPKRTSSGSQATQVAPTAK